jgi:alkanesulfonate monooxygenase SsuD/methylene tetrahydromethanopterin reductase-like flavin-dependent oxidoreductase (luciferase family)
MDLAFGVVDHIDRQSFPLTETFESRLKLMRKYDEAGFYCFHLTEHHFTPLGMAPSPNIFLAAAASITENLRLGSLVYLLPLYDPMRLAMEICMLDNISKGRVDVGVGRGISPFELAYYDVNHLEAPAIYREALEVLMKALTQETVFHDGRYYKYLGAPMELAPVQKPHPPLWYGVAHPGGVGWPAENNVNVITNRKGELAKAIFDAYREHWKGANGSGGLEPKLGITSHIFVAETQAEAEEAGNRGFKKWYDSFSHLWCKFDPIAVNDPDRPSFVRPVIYGTPEMVRETIAREVAESGANYFVARFAFGDLSYQESARSFDLFADEIMPHFRRKKAAE